MAGLGLGLRLGGRSTHFLLLGDLDLGFLLHNFGLSGDVLQIGSHIDAHATRESLTWREILQIAGSSLANCTHKPLPPPAGGSLRGQILAEQGAELKLVDFVPQVAVASGLKVVAAPGAGIQSIGQQLVGRGLNH